MSEEAKVALLEAANVIEAQGWTQGYYWDIEQANSGIPVHLCRVCAMGALNIAIHGSPDDLAKGTGERVANECFAAVRKEIGRAMIAAWNDDDERTAEEVISALRRAAEGISA
jgi:hypothetical protein